MTVTLSPKNDAGAFTRCLMDGWYSQLSRLSYRRSSTCEEMFSVLVGKW